jgi:hypothetical protein
MGETAEPAWVPAVPSLARETVSALRVVTVRYAAAVSDIQVMRVTTALPNSRIMMETASANPIALRFRVAATARAAMRVVLQYAPVLPAGRGKTATSKLLLMRKILPMKKILLMGKLLLMKKTLLLSVPVYPRQPRRFSATTTGQRTIA